MCTCKVKAWTVCAAYCVVTSVYALLFFSDCQMLVRFILGTRKSLYGRNIVNNKLRAYWVNAMFFFFRYFEICTWERVFPISRLLQSVGALTFNSILSSLLLLPRVYNILVMNWRVNVQALRGGFLETFGCKVERYCLGTLYKNQPHRWVNMIYTVQYMTANRKWLFSAIPPELLSFVIFSWRWTEFTKVWVCKWFFCFTWGYLKYLISKSKYTNRHFYHHIVQYALKYAIL